MELPVVVNGVEELRGLVGEQVGPSEWRQVTQADIDLFAELSGDHQWIHTDPDRAAKESPYGTTIAHGNLTLSLIDGFRTELLRVDGAKLGINYGWDRVRFPAPVISGTRTRATAELTSFDELGDGWFAAVTRFTVEAEGQDKPACVADSVVRFLFG
jgi:acyl dehydratase